MLIVNNQFTFDIIFVIDKQIDPAMSAEPPEHSRDQQISSAPVRRYVPIAPTGDVHVLAFLSILSAINQHPCLEHLERTADFL